MFTAMDLTMCPNLAVPAEVMRHVVKVESGSNPFAIGVVGGQLARQPASLGEALATVQMLDAKGYDYSLGVAQVNRRNLGRYGLDSYAKAFDACANVAAGAQILAECYGRSGNDWGKAFSCYYSGDFVTGYRDGYVQKIYASMQTGVPSLPSAAAPIPLEPMNIARQDLVARARHATGASGYRVAIRSVALDAAAAAAVSTINRAIDVRVAQPTEPEPEAPSPEAAGMAPPPPVGFNAGVFRPVVRGPNDPTPTSPQDSGPATAATPLASDRADLREEQRDAAFVF